MARANVELPGIDLDLSDSIVEKATASSLDLELAISNAQVPGRKVTRVLLRFEGIRDFEEIWYRLTTKVRKSRRTEFHSAWPLRLPAKLKTLVEVNSRGKLRKFQLAVAEEHFRGRKKPLEFSCKRFSITDTKGKFIAGDPSRISSFRKWSKKDYIRLADQLASSIENLDYKSAHSHFESKLAKTKTLNKFTEQLQRYMKPDRDLKSLMKSFRAKKPYRHLVADPQSFADILPRRVDIDDVVAVVDISFLGWFAISVVITERDQELKVLDYTIDRDWLAIF